jgi:hypothetical protein
VYSYCVCGLSIASEIGLPGLIAAPAAPGPAEVVIRSASVPDALAHASDHGPNWQRAGDLILMHVPGVARFLLRSGAEIVFEPEGATPCGDIAAFAVGTVFGILLHQRGGMVLHASAVGVGDRAVLFCGPSGAGKSTLAAALEQRGHPLLNDDVCLLDTDPTGAPIVLSDGRGLDLWADAIDPLGLAARQGPAVRAGFGKFHVLPRETPNRAMRLGAIYVLRPARPPFHEGIESPNVIDATLLIQQSAYHPRLVAVLQHKRRCFLSAAHMAAKAGVYTLTQPRDFGRLAASVDRLQAHWRATGLCGARP